jgi:DNA-binding ferritin-like protein
MSDYKQLIQSLKKAAKLAEDNIDKAHNIDLEDMMQQLESYVDELEGIKKFEVYPEEFEEL